MQILKLTRFGNPILRARARHLSVDEVKSDKVKMLIADIRYTNQKKEYGMGIAAPQVGESVALSVIGIKPTPTRPNLEVFEQVIINPTYQGVGRRAGMWEGCQSCGEGENILFGMVPRYGKIKATWHDEHGVYHNETIAGFTAHVFQHETDHLNGILFVDKVKDPNTYMMADEYRKRIVEQKEDKHEKSKSSR